MHSFEADRPGSGTEDDENEHVLEPKGEEDIEGISMVDEQDKVF